MGDEVIGVRLLVLTASNRGKGIQMSGSYTEDEPMIADLSEMSTASGYEVCGTACTVDAAVALGELHKLTCCSRRSARAGRPWLRDRSAVEQRGKIRRPLLDR